MLRTKRRLSRLKPQQVREKVTCMDGPDRKGPDDNTSESTSSCEPMFSCRFGVRLIRPLYDSFYAEYLSHGMIEVSS
jgi:hypothetical protein